MGGNDSRSYNVQKTARTEVEDEMDDRPVHASPACEPLFKLIAC